MLGLFLNRIHFRLIFLLPILATAGCAHKIKLPGALGDSSGGSLSLIHFNDGMSRLLNAGAGYEDYGGVARFATVVSELKRDAATLKKTSNALITVSAGNDFRAGQIFNVSLRKGIPFYDATALDIVGVDAILVAGRAFDMGPDIFAEYTEGFSRTHPTFLSANLDFSKEPALSSLAEDGVILPSTIIERGGHKYGLIGISPSDIREKSSPRRVTVHADLVDRVRGKVDEFLETGVNRIILLANFGSLEKIRNLVRKTRGIDIVVYGAAVDPDDPDSLRFLSESDGEASSYPAFETDAAGRNVVLAGTCGMYCFVGRIQAVFDSYGEISALSSGTGARKVLGDGLPGAVRPDPSVNRSVVIPLARALSTTSRTVGVSQIVLDGAPNHTSSRETNLGDFTADAILWRAAKLAESYGAQPPTVALVKSSIFKANLPKGNISDADVFAAFSSTDPLSVVEEVAPVELKAMLECMLASTGQGGGDDAAFPQVAGLRMVFNPTRPPGARVKSVRLDSGDAVVLNYKVLPFAPKVNVATVGALPFKRKACASALRRRVNLGEIPQNAVMAFLSGSSKTGGLNGLVPARNYPMNGLRRILITRE